MVPVLKELLDHIIAEDIFHELDSVWLNLSKNAVLLVAVRCLKLLLDESGAVLVTAEFCDMIVYFLTKFLSDQCLNVTNVTVRNVP